MAETLVVFHRCGGKSLGYPPNTLFTAKWAMNFGARAVEYDIVACRSDGRYEIVAIEPKLIKEAGLNINDLDWKDVRSIDTGNEKSGAGSPVTLAAMLKEIPTAKVAHQIHIKGANPNTLDALLPIVHEYSNVILTTFDIAVINEIRKRNGSIPVGWLVKPAGGEGSEGLEDLTAKVMSGKELPPYSPAELADILKTAKQHGVNAVILCAPRIQDKRTIEAVHAAGFEAGAWGIGTNLDLARRLIAFGLGRFTLDNPEQLQR